MSESIMPGYSKSILCLANSRKPSGRCIAGKTKHGQWIRPVSSRPGGELSEADRWFENGKDPAVGDIVRVDFLRKQAHPFQTENHVIDENVYWTFVRKSSFDEIRGLVDRVDGEIWSPSSSSYNGLRDRHAEASSPLLGESLKLVEVNDLVFVVRVEGAEYKKRILRGKFSLNGIQYWLRVTDPLLERRYIAGGDQEHAIGRALLCISLGEPWQDFTYKLIAGVILPF